MRIPFLIQSPLCNGCQLKSLEDIGQLARGQWVLLGVLLAPLLAGELRLVFARLLPPGLGPDLQARIQPSQPPCHLLTRASSWTQLEGQQQSGTRRTTFGET